MLGLKIGNSSGETAPHTEIRKLIKIILKRILIYAHSCSLGESLLQRDAVASSASNVKFSFLHSSLVRHL